LKRSGVILCTHGHPDHVEAVGGDPGTKAGPR